MNITAMPRSDMPRMESSRADASRSVRTAVGSSRIKSFSCSLLSSRAISVNCLWPTGMSLMTMLPSMWTPILSMALSAASRMAGRSSVFSLGPNTSAITLFFWGSRLSSMFSVAVKPGISENSWCTMPMPAARASKGEAKLTFCPLSMMSPPYPPVSRMTFMPNRIFISVLLPAPFSPTRPSTSPSFRVRLMSVST